MSKEFNLNHSIKGSLKDRLVYFSDASLQELAANPPGSTSFSIKVDAEGSFNFCELPKLNDEPGLIFTKLPMSDRGDDYKIGYFPSYFSLNPCAKYDYIKWLHNISATCDTGFLFLYLYGLERHLVTGDIDKAVSEILELRKHHSNKSFDSYSQNSIIYGCLIRKRLDLVSELLDSKYLVNNIFLELAYRSGRKLNLYDVMQLIVKCVPVAKNALKKNKVLLQRLLGEALISRHGRDGFDLVSCVDLGSLNKNLEPAFSNHSFPREVRFAEVNNYLKHKPMIEAMASLFQPVYEEFKIINKGNGVN